MGELYNLSSSQAAATVTTQRGDEVGIGLRRLLVVRPRKDVLNFAPAAAPDSTWTTAAIGFHAFLISSQGELHVDLLPVLQLHNAVLDDVVPVGGDLCGVENGAKGL
eukprot:6214044-Pleurochrysis_carterae.AAC.1